MQIALLTALTMIAFAANSVLGRLALGTTAMDPASFTLIRLLSGAVMLALLAGGGRARSRGGNWPSALALFGYAAAFSFAYLTLDTGTGALILFATVQATMIGWGLVQGERPAALEWVGMAVAFGAFVWLMSARLTAPDPIGALLMGLSGLAWGIYSLRGRAEADALRATAGNFLRAVPLAVGLAIVFAGQLTLPLSGVAFAVLSGAVTSGWGYALWYRVLRSISAVQGALVQLTVPAIATAAGILLLGEVLTARFVVCSLLILGGVATSVLARERRVPLAE